MVRVVVPSSEAIKSKPKQVGGLGCAIIHQQRLRQADDVIVVGGGYGRSTAVIYLLVTCVVPIIPVVCYGGCAVGHSFG